VGEIVRYKRDVWGEEVILGVSWDLLWVVAVSILVLLAAHAIIMAALANKKIDKPSGDGARVVRHEAVDRWFHWVMAGRYFGTDRHRRSSDSWTAVCVAGAALDLWSTPSFYYVISYCAVLVLAGL